jgi:hypothetical protein
LSAIVKDKNAKPIFLFCDHSLKLRDHKII